MFALFLFVYMVLVCFLFFRQTAQRFHAHDTWMSLAQRKKTTMSKFGEVISNSETEVAVRTRSSLCSPLSWKTKANEYEKQIFF